MKNQNKLIRPWRLFSITIAFVFCFATKASADIQLDFVYDPETNITTATYYGTWDVSATGGGLVTFPSVFFTGTSANAQTSGIDIGFNSEAGISSAFYPWSETTQPSGSGHLGDNFGFAFDTVWGPVGFTDTTIISGSVMFEELTLSALGFDENEILFGGMLTGSAGTVNWTASVAAVPEPSSFALLFGLVIMGAVFVRRRRD